MKILKRVVTALILLSTTVMAGEGNGSSGGGHIYGDQLNPWFLQNTKTVTYCVRVWPNFSKLSPARINELVKDAFGFWSQKFAEVNNEIPEEPGTIRLGTQDFIQTKCSANTDITFQMGHLTKTQKKAIPSYEHTAGVAMRTEYDTKQLRGRGFIYMAPERGSMRPQSTNLFDRFWSIQEGERLKLAILHELGHVFGLQDNYYAADSFKPQLMSADFVESLVSNLAFGSKQEILLQPLGCKTHSDVRFTTSIPMPGAPRHLQEFMNMPAKDSVIHTVWENETLTFSSASGPLGVVDMKGGTVTDSNFSNAIRLWLPAGQEVVTGPLAERQIVTVHRIATMKLVEGLLIKLKTGETKKVVVTMDNQCMPQLGAVINGEMFINVTRWKD